MGGVSVLKLNGVGLLDNDTLDKIIRDDVERVNQWKGGSLRNLWNFLAHCDTPFYHDSKSRFGVRTWLYIDARYHSAEINYILEGHAMRHVGMREGEASRAVWDWKLLWGRVRPSKYQNTWTWFWKGWDEYDFRASW